MRFAVITSRLNPGAVVPSATNIGTWVAAAIAVAVIAAQASFHRRPTKKQATEIGPANIRYGNIAPNANSPRLATDEYRATQRGTQQAEGKETNGDRQRGAPLRMGSRGPPLFAQKAAAWALIHETMEKSKS